MKIEIRKVGSNGGTIIRDIDRFEVAPPVGDYIIQAEIDEGDSPMQILVSKEQRVAVKHLRLTRSSTYRVKQHQRNWPKQPSVVREHDARKPVNLKHYGQDKSPEARAKTAKALQAYWAKMTPEQRSKEAKRRMAMRTRTKNGHAQA